MCDHLAHLHQLNTSVLLIGDQQHKYFQNGQLVTEENFANKLSLPDAAIDWSWWVSPEGELPDSMSLQGQVGVWSDWQDKHWHE